MAAIRDSKGRFVKGSGKNRVGVSIKWKGATVDKEVKTGVERNLDKAAIFLAGDIRRQFPGSGIAGATRSEREGSRSKPGEIPHVQTARLQNSIGHDAPKKLVRRVGSGIGTGNKNPGYALFLEFGTRSITQRPFLRPSLIRNRSKLRKAMTKKVLK